MNKLRVHSVEQPDSDITTFILSCDRLHLLQKTITSFIQTCNEDTKLVIVDDSGNSEIFDKLVNLYGNRFDIICFPENRGQWWALDFMVSYCYTDYIFYVEDDWEFLQPGYLQKSKDILKCYRHIGNIDISRRTHEEYGFKTYSDTIIDNEFNFKKQWRISDRHYYWVGWQGSPNLKRRDDLILLGRIEKWYNEWNIDRKFHALGFKSVYLKDKYVEHLGDTESKMEGKRPNDAACPEDYFPKELLNNRIYPTFDYYHLERAV